MTETEKLLLSLYEQQDVLNKAARKLEEKIDGACKIWREESGVLCRPHKATMKENLRRKYRGL